MIVKKADIKFQEWQLQRTVTTTYVQFTMYQTLFYFVYTVGTLCVCACLILVILQGPLCDFLHFTDEETDT